MDALPTPSAGRWWPLVAICLGTFILLVDVTIVGVALPSMAGDLHARLSSLQWVIDAYALSLAALLLLGGSLADRFGRSRVFQIGLVMFAAASLCCALSPNAGLLIASRAVQGVGAAAMFATNSALLNATYAGRDRGVALGVWGAVTGAAAAIAPILGGLLIDGFDWRAIFLVNLPIAALAVAMTGRVLTESRGHAGALDWAGASAFTLCAGSLTFALIHGGESGWGATATLSAFAAAALIVFLAVEPRRVSPLMDLALLRDPSFATLMLAAVALSAGAFAPVVYTQLWLQSVLRLSPIDAGLVVAPMAAVAFAVSAGVGRFMHRIPPRLPLGIGLLAIGGGALLRSTISATSGWGVLIPGLLVTGVGVGRRGQPGPGARRPRSRRPDPQGARQPRHPPRLRDGAERHLSDRRADRRVWRRARAGARAARAGRCGRARRQLNAGRGSGRARTASFGPHRSNAGGVARAEMRLLLDRVV